MDEMRFFFFFQAEDGIRDHCVTGVQTCALPICKGTAAGIPNLAGQRGRYVMASLKEYKDGVRVHAALRTIAATMGDVETRQVAAFYASLPPVPASKAEVFSPYERGKTVSANCATCHGADGNSKIAGTPNLAGQQPRYFVAATQEYLMG